MKHRKRAGAKLLLHSLQQQVNRLQLQEQQLETDNVCLSVQSSLLASCCDMLHTLRTGSVHPGWHLWLGCKESWLPEELPLLRELSDTLPESTSCNLEQQQQQCLLHNKQQLQEGHYVQVLLDAPAAAASHAARVRQQDQHVQQQQQQDVKSQCEPGQQQQQQQQPGRELQLADHSQQEQQQPHQQQRLKKSTEQQPASVQVQEEPQQLNLESMQRLPGVHTRPHSLTESNSVASTVALAVGACPTPYGAAGAAATAAGAAASSSAGGGGGVIGSGAAREGAPERQQQQQQRQDVQPLLMQQHHQQQPPQHAQQHSAAPQTQAQQYFLTTQGDYLVALRHALSLPPYQGAATMTLEGFRDYYSGLCKEMALNLALAQQQGREDDMCSGGVHPLLRLRELILQQAHVVSTLMLLHCDGLMNTLRVVNLNTLELSDEAEKSWRRMDWLADQLELDAKQEATLISGTALFKRLLEHNRQERQQLSAQQGVQAEQRLATGRAVDLQAQTDSATRLAILLKKEQLLMVMASLFTAGCLSVVQTAKAAVLCWPFIPTLGILGAVLAARKA